MFAKMPSMVVYLSVALNVDTIWWKKHIKGLSSQTCMCEACLYDIVINLMHLVVECAMLKAEVQQQ
jgi:TRAP-type uncharacterized transport system fused permease subunit